MQITSFLRKRSIAARVLIVLFLMVFVFLCGMHFGGAHHDDDGDALVVAVDVLLLTLGAAALIAVTGFPSLRTGDGDDRGMGLPCVTRRTSWADPTAREGLPLRC